MVHTYELAIPIFVPIWLSRFETLDIGVAQFDVTLATIGLVVGAGYALFGIGALPGGILVDRIGSRRLIVGCLLGMSASYLLLSVAPSLAIVGVALLLWGASASVYHPAGLALISKGVSERGTGFAYHGIAGNLGIGLGPLVTAVLLLFFDWSVVASLLAIPALLAALYATRAEFDETAAVASSGAEADGGDSKASAGVESFGEFLAESRRLFVGSFVLVFAIVMCSGLYYRGTLTFLPGLLGDLLGSQPIPVTDLLPGVPSGEGSHTATFELERYVYGGLLVIGVFGQYVGGKLTDRIRVERGIAVAFAGLAVLAVVFLPLARISVPTLLFACALLGFSLFVVQPFYQAAVAEYTPAGTRGLSYGYTYLGVFGVGALGSFIAGVILNYATPTVLFLTLAGFAATASVLGAYLSRREGRAIR
jgi:MFS family permease